VTDVCDVRIGVDGCTNKQEIRDRVAGALETAVGYARVTLTGELAPDIDLQAIDLEDVASNLDSPPIIRLESVTGRGKLTLNRLGRQRTRAVVVSGKRAIT